MDFSPVLSRDQALAEIAAWRHLPDRHVIVDFGVPCSPGPFCRYGLTTAANDPGLDSVGRGICRICHVDKKPCLHVPVELIGVGRVLTAAIGHLRGLQHIGMSMGVPNGADWDRTVIEQFGRLKEVYHRAAMVF